MDIHYLDSAATTRVCPEAVQAAAEAMTENWGNPSSRYAAGTKAAASMKQWRGDVAGALGCAPGELYFTSCGTEGDNWAILGACQLNRRRGKHIVTTAVEHAAVLETCRYLEQQGYEVTRLMPDRNGNISVTDLEKALRPDTVLVSMMLVNNETGNIFPVAEAVQALRRSGSPALFHCDAVQGFLKVPFSAGKLGADLITVSGHKVHAPKGVGALYVRKGVRLPPLLHGGGQEEGMRSGTEATAQIAAFAAAVRTGAAAFREDSSRMARLKDHAVRVLQEKVPDLKCIGDGQAPHILAVTMPGFKSEVVVRFLSDRGIYVSSGSACHRGKPSHVYRALGLPKPWLDGALRISFSSETTREDVDALAEGLQEAHRQLFTTLS